MSMPVTPLNLRLQVVKHLATGKTPDLVATITGLPRATIVDIGGVHGYPDKDKLAWAVDILAKKVDEESALPVRVPERPTPAPVASMPVKPAAQTDEIRALLNTAKAHPSKRIQAAANRLLDDVAKLRRLIAEDEEKNSERRKAEAEKAAARAEVKKLEAQLVAAKAKLRSPAAPKVPATGGVSPKDIRRWAADNGVECTSVGIVPKAVREAYDAAHPEAVAS